MYGGAFREGTCTLFEYRFNDFYRLFNTSRIKIQFPLQKHRLFSSLQFRVPQHVLILIDYEAFLSTLPVVTWYFYPNVCVTKHPQSANHRKNLSQIRYLHSYMLFLSVFCTIFLCSVYVFVDTHKHSM